MQHSLRSVALLTLQPERHLSGFQSLGLRPALLTFQPALRQPQDGRWQLLPPAPPCLVVDLAGLGVVVTAMVLADLLRELRPAGCRLVFLVPQEHIAARRLLVISDLAGVVIPADASPTLLHRWLAAPITTADQLVWVEQAPPPFLALHQHLVPLVAALAHADSVPEAAGWCYLSTRRAYEVLTDCARQMHLPLRPRRRARQWAADLNRALASPRHYPPKLKKEDTVDFHPFDVIAANLCGCVIERIHSSAGELVLEVDEPRQGRLTLRCQGGELVNPPEEYADLAERSVWERRIDWADIVAEDIIALYLADERALLLRLKAGRFERATAVG